MQITLDSKIISFLHRLNQVGLYIKIYILNFQMQLFTFEF